MNAWASIVAFRAALLVVNPLTSGISSAPGRRYAIRSRNHGSGHPDIDTPISYSPDFGLPHSNRRPDPSAAAGAPASQPDKPDKKNEADNEAQFHFSSHRNWVCQRARCFAIADEGVNQHDRADPVNASIKQSKWTNGTNRTARELGTSSG